MQLPPPCSLQYSDITCDGLYDLWGDFGGVDQNTPVTGFPRLAQLENISYQQGDRREVPPPPLLPSCATYASLVHCFSGYCLDAIADLISYS